MTRFELLSMPFGDQIVLINKLSTKVNILKLNILKFKKEVEKEIKKPVKLRNTVYKPPVEFEKGEIFYLISMNLRESKVILQNKKNKKEYKFDFYELIENSKRL